MITEKELGVSAESLVQFMNLNMSPQTAGYIINGAMKLDAARQQGDADSVEKVIADMRKLREWCEHSPLDNLIDRLEAIGKSK